MSSSNFGAAEPQGGPLASNVEESKETTSSPSSSPVRHRRTSFTKVLQGKLSMAKHHHKTSGTASGDRTPPAGHAHPDADVKASDDKLHVPDVDGDGKKHSHPHRPHHRHQASDDGSLQIIEQVKQWLINERERRQGSSAVGDALREPARYSPTSESLDRLEDILSAVDHGTGSSYFAQAKLRPRSIKSNRGVSHTGSMSDAYTTDNADRTILQKVPECDVVLDNTKEHSVEFRTEILKLTHTLRVKGWRRVKLDRGAELKVNRISGALTNAVYKVTPPYVDPLGDLPLASSSSSVNLQDKSAPESGQGTPKRTPRQPNPLLLRIYGPQVGHLIDRDSELNILYRLATQHVGPRLLGTFQNGRFEEFYDATTLTRKDIRIPETSRLIGRRLRELHDHIPLMDYERARGPSVWNNWDKWVARGETVMQTLEERQPGKRFLITKWDVLRMVVEQRYRPWLMKNHGGEEELKKIIIFAHNDTQYGNIMSKNQLPEPPAQPPRMADMPSGTISAPRSPRLTPKASKSNLTAQQQPHQNLLVIDFEYAGANSRGFEFANHFCEWMSDYHCLLAPTAHTVHHELYPTIEEQRNIIHAYVEYRPLPYVIPTEESVRKQLLNPGPGPKRSSSNVNLDRLAHLSKNEQEEIEREVDRLVTEAKNWRASANCSWALWGIVQANVPGVQVTENGEAIPDDEPKPDNTTGAQGGELEEEDEFDYIKYAEQKAMIFWGDMLIHGLVTEDEMVEWSGVKDFKSKLKSLDGK